MEMTIQTLVILVVVLIIGMILLGIITSWGNTGKGLLDNFFGWLGGIKSVPK